MSIDNRKVCANCVYEYQEHTNLGYDHYEPNICKKSNEVCSDIWNTTCNKFAWKNKVNGEQK